MTNPYVSQQQVPTAQRPWVPQGGGYDPGQQSQQVQLPAALQQQMQQAQSQQQLPPQMQQGQPDGPGSPLSQMPPVPFPQQQRQQQAPQQQMQQPSQQQQFPPNPGAFPQQQAPVQQQPMVLSGPGVPQELQGRTLQEAISIYNGMRQTHLQQMAAPQQQTPQQQPIPPQQGVAPQPAQGNAPFDWRNPGKSVAQVVDDRLNQIIDQRLMPVLAPIAQQNALGGINTARQQAANMVGQANWTAMEPEIMQALAGADPRALSNPQIWITAAQAVLGGRMMRGQQPQQQMQQQQQPGMYPVQQVQPGHNPLPNLNSFFSEQPNQGGPTGGGFQLTQAQRSAAHAMGIPETDYAAWAVGVGRNG